MSDTKIKTGRVVKPMKGDKTLLLSKARASVTHQLMGGAVLLVVGLMIFNVGSFTTWAATQDTANLNVNVGAGVLEILNVETQVDFTSAVSGVASEESAEVDNIAISDYRAGPAQWNLWANSANLVNAGTDYINAANLTIFPTEAVKDNTNTFNTSDVGNGSDGATLDANTLLFNSAFNDTGIITFNSLDINVTVNATLNADDYDGTLTFSLIAT